MSLKELFKIFSYRKSIFLFRFFYGWRLGSLGCKSIIKSPLLWTPSHIFLGDNVHIQSGCRIEGVSHWMGHRFNPQIIVEDGVSIEQSCHLTAMGLLRIGRGTLITYGVMITDIDHEYRDVDLKVLSQPILNSLTEIGESCFIGAGAKIQAGTQLGKHCVVGANAVVRGVFPDYSVIVGVPARVIKRFETISKKWLKTDKYGNFLE